MCNYNTDAIIPCNEPEVCALDRLDTADMFARAWVADHYRDRQTCDLARQELADFRKYDDASRKWAGAHFADRIADRLEIKPTI